MSAPESRPPRPHRNTLRQRGREVRYNGLGRGGKQLTVLAGDVATHRGVVHLVGGGEGEDVRGARHAPGGRGGAVAQTELVEVQPDLTDVGGGPADGHLAGGGGGVARPGEVGVVDPHCALTTN